MKREPKTESGERRRKHQLLKKVEKHEAFGIACPSQGAYADTIFASRLISYLIFCYRNHQPSVTKKSTEFTFPNPMEGHKYLTAPVAAEALVKSGNIKHAAEVMLKRRLVSPSKSIHRLQQIATQFKQKKQIGSVNNTSL